MPRNYMLADSKNNSNIFKSKSVNTAKVGWKHP